MTWQEVQQKYQIAARATLGEDASQEEIALFVYRTIVQKSCSTNEFFDRMAYKAPIRSMKPESLLNIIQSCRSVISWTRSSSSGIGSSSGGASGWSMISDSNMWNSVLQPTSQREGHVLEMESCKILSASGEGHLHQLRHLLQPSIAPSIHEDVVATIGGDGGSPPPTSSSSISIINANDSIINNNNNGDDVYYSVSSPQLTTSAASMSFFLCLFMSKIQHLDVHNLDHMLTWSF